MSIATELQNYNDGLLDAYTAVDTKGGTLPENKNLANLDTAIASIPAGGGDVVNAVIKQFKATTTDISASSFVEFVAGIESSASTTISDLQGTGYSAIALSSSQVFVTYAISTVQLSGAICTISGDTITVGTTVNISGVSNGINNVHTDLVDTNTVLLLHRASSGLDGIVIQIENDTITVGTPVTIASSYSPYNFTMTKLDTNKEIVMYRGSNSVQAAILSISNGSFTVGAAFRVNSENYSDAYYGSSLTKIDSTHVFATHASKNYSLVGEFLSVSGTTISRIADISPVTIYSGSGLGNISSSPEQGILLSEGKILLGFATYECFNYSVISFNSDYTSVSATAPEFVDVTSTQARFVIYKLGNLIYVVTSYPSGNSNYYPKTRMMVGEMQNDKFVKLGSSIVSEDQVYTIDAQNTICPLDSTHLFLLTKHLSNTQMGQIITLSDPTVKLAENSIFGVTKTTATTSTAGDVYILGTGA